MKPNYEYAAIVYNCYDGDTFKAIVDLGFGVSIKQTFRLYGVDTPEMRGTEKDEGVIVRDFVRSKILNKDIIIITRKDKTGKYGRYLAEVYYHEDDIGQVHLANRLLSEGMAVEMKY